MARRFGIATLAAAGAIALAALGSPGTGHAGNASGAAITLTQTVMVDTGVDQCGTETSIVVPPGTTVRFCYSVLNTGSVTLTSHTLNATFDGLVLNSFPYSLAPGASAFITSTEVINTTVTNAGTWMATNDNNDSAQSTASATVTIASTQHSADGTVSAVFTAQSSCSLNITITVADEGDDTAVFTVGSTARPAGVASSDIVTYIGFGEGNFQFDGFDVALGSSLNGTYTFQVTKSGGDGTAGITNPVIVNVLVEDLPLCGQHSAIVALVDSSACSLDLSVVVSDGTDDTAVFTVGSTSRPPGVGSSTTTTYIGFPEGTFAFDNFSVGPGDSLNGTYTFTVNKTSGSVTDGSENPITLEYVVSDLPTCGARVIIEKVTVGGFGGPFRFEVLEGDEGENLVASPTGSTGAADTATEMYDAYGVAGFYRVRELFEVGDPTDTSTWDAGDGFFPDEMTCTLLDADGETINTNSALPVSSGVIGLGSRVDDGETLSCVVTNEAPGTIIIHKSTPGSQSSPSFGFTGDFTFSLAGGESKTFDGLEPGGYLFTESALEGWTLTSAGCEGKFKYDAENRSLLVAVGPGDTVECEFVNTADEVTTTTAEPTTTTTGPTTTAATTTTTAGDSGAGLPTTTRPRTLPTTGASSNSGNVVMLGFGLVVAGSALMFTRRRTVR